MLAAAAAIALFFLVWGLLQDGGEAAPYIPAGVIASISLGGAVILREVILRRARDRFLASQRLERSLRSIRPKPEAEKLTIEQISAAVGEIKRRSDAAKVLGRFAESHFDVFEMCEQFLAAASRELPFVAPGSPRLAALRRGKRMAGALHKYHLLQWAELRSKAITQEARSKARLTQKLRSANEALEVIEFAVGHYPHDLELRESESALTALIASLKATNSIEKAERAKAKGNNKRAISMYKDALAHLSHGGAGSKSEALETINAEIEALRTALAGK